MTESTFDELLFSAKNAKESTELHIPSTWTQGRTTYGGLITALIYSNLQTHIQPSRKLHSITTSFNQPLITDTPFQINTTIIREGKSLTLAKGYAHQQGKEISSILACFGEGLESMIEIQENPPTDFIPPEQGTPLPYLPNKTPAFLQHIDFSQTIGDFPFSGSTNPQMGGWMRFRQAPNHITDAHIIGLIDAWPPTLLPLLTTRTMASTITWNLELLQPLPSIEPTEYLAYHANTRSAKNGYGHTEASIWNTAGQLIAISRQTVIVYG